LKSTAVISKSNSTAVEINRFNRTSTYCCFG